MASLFGASSASSANDMQARKEQMKAQITQELAIANAQQLINKINENCFAKCVTRPSTSLGSSEESCLSRCLTLYMAAFDQTSKSYVARVSREREALGASGIGGEGLSL